MGEFNEERVFRMIHALNLLKGVVEGKTTPEEASNFPSEDTVHGLILVAVGLLNSQCSSPQEALSVLESVEHGLSKAYWKEMGLE